MINPSTIAIDFNVLPPVDGVVRPALKYFQVKTVSSKSPCNDQYFTDRQHTDKDVTAMLLCWQVILGNVVQGHHSDKQELSSKYVNRTRRTQQW